MQLVVLCCCDVTEHAGGLACMKKLFGQNATYTWDYKHRQHATWTCLQEYTGNAVASLHPTTVTT